MTDRVAIEREHPLAGLLGDGDVRQLLDREMPAPLQSLLNDAALRRLRVLVDPRSVSPLHGIAGFVQHLRAACERAGRPALRLQVFLLGNGLTPLRDEGLPALEALIEDVARPLFEVRRRVDGHFRQQPLALPHENEGQVRLLHATAVAQFLRTAADTLPDGVHLLQAEPLCSWRALVEAAAAAADIPVREPDGRPDPAAELVRLALRHAEQRHLLDNGTEGASRTPPALPLHVITSQGIDWRARVATVVRARLAEHRAAEAPRWTALPGVQRRTTACGTAHYLRRGNGPTALLLVNAFGLTIDAWHDLSLALGDDVTLLALDGAAPGENTGGVPKTYYDDADSLRRFVANVSALLAEEGLATCHVASWCSGAKFAIELARVLPHRVATLSLFAPSFAGAVGGPGGDSAYETNLHTMCKVVDRLPQAAPSMAQSMMALLDKAAPDGGEAAPSDLFARADTVMLPWLHEPFASAQNMIDYSRQLLNFRAHELGPNPDGAPLTLPVLLVTGQADSTTCGTRARAICTSLLGNLLHLELQHAGHYFLHQNSALVARLLLDFMRYGLEAVPPHPRLQRMADTEEALVSGEL